MPTVGDEGELPDSLPALLVDDVTAAMDAIATKYAARAKSAVFIGMNPDSEARHRRLGGDWRRAIHGRWRGAIWRSGTLASARL